MPMYVLTSEAVLNFNEAMLGYATTINTYRALDTENPPFFLHLSYETAIINSRKLFFG